MPITKNKGISRIDSEACRTYGWYVRARFNGKVVSKLFSDKKHGGKAKALMKARRFYKKALTSLIKKNSDLKSDKIPVKTIISRNRKNNTGIVGVQKIIRKNPGGSVYKAYRVNWTDTTGKSRTKFFSVDKLGDRQAFKQAKIHRKEKVLENYYGKN
jgi:hypothetical protein